MVDQLVGFVDWVGAAERLGANFFGGDGYGRGSRGLGAVFTAS